MTLPQNRRLPNIRIRCVMLAIQEVIGTTGLNLVLRQSGLDRYTGALPPADHQLTVLASEYAGLHKAIEDYFGRGARGSLRRIGRAAFQQSVESRSLATRFNHAILRLLPPDSRKLRILEQLAADLAEPDGVVSIHRDDRHFLLVDATSDATLGRTHEGGVCWLTVGEIQEALLWGLGQEFDVVEVTCKAQGDPACRFKIGEVIG